MVDYRDADWHDVVRYELLSVELLQRTWDGWRRQSNLVILSNTSICSNVITGLYSDSNDPLRQRCMDLNASRHHRNHRKHPINRGPRTQATPSQSGASFLCYFRYLRRACLCLIAASSIKLAGMHGPQRWLHKHLTSGIRYKKFRGYLLRVDIADDLEWLIDGFIICISKIQHT